MSSPSSAEPFFIFEGIEKRYDGQRVLGPVDLSLENGKTHVLIGPSGCGKSTLLRLVMGLIRADAGTMLVAGESFDRLDLLAHRRRMGYVIQEGGLFPHLTARENATLVARHIGWTDDACRSRLAELAELVQLPLEFLDRYPAQLSGGQRQRVGLMRALMLKPSALLLDEPLAALDPMVRADLQRDLKRLFQLVQATVVFVTHDLNEAERLGDSLTLLRDGHIVQTGTADEFARSPAEPFVTEFLEAQR